MVHKFIVTTVETSKRRFYYLISAKNREDLDKKLKDCSPSDYTEPFDADSPEEVVQETVTDIKEVIENGNNN